MSEAETVERPEGQTEEQRAAQAEERSRIEAEARRQGWRPKDEFSDARTWVDAPEFLERGKQFQGILRRENRQLKEQVEELTRRQKESAEVFEQFREFHKTTEERAYKKAKRELEKQRDTAATTGDMDGYRRNQAEIDDLERERAAAAVPEQRPAQDRAQPATPQQPDPYVAEWVRENPWFNDEPDANDYAQGVHTRLAKEEPTMSIRDNLAEVRRRVVKRFPELFGNVRREAPSAVTPPSGGAGGTQRRKEKGYSDLPADAKKACDKFVKQGLMTQEQYVKEYDWSA